MDRTFSLLAKTVLQAEDLEQLTRPLLEMLGSVTGMESTYLTTIDLAQGVQHVEFACNTDRLHIPEGLNVPWADTLCKRALDEGRMHTDNVSECWGDSEAARALGIRTYVSSPVKTQDGRLLGTLCAASAQPHPLNPSSASTLGLFSRFIGMFIERELLVAQLTAANERLSALALTDSLTALPNRLAIMTDLSRMLAQARREGTLVLVGIIDLDGFKVINDNHGHQAGDHFLQEVAKRMRHALRDSDVIGRLGGDEFVVLGPIHQNDASVSRAEHGRHAAQVLQQRLSTSTVGTYDLSQVTLNYAGASIGVVVADPCVVNAQQAIHLADAEMYRIKQARRASRAQGETRVMVSRTASESGLSRSPRKGAPPGQTS